MRENLGQDAKQFFNSPVGEYMADCVSRDLDMLRDDLEKCDIQTPWGRRKWRRIKMELEAVRRVNRYLVELYSECATYQERENMDEYA